MPPPADPRPEPAEPVPAPGRSRAGARARVRANAAAPWLLLLGLLAAPASRAGDTLAVRAEVGAAGEYSNEQFYESAIDDTIFLGRQLHDTPEARLAAVARAEFMRTFGAGRWQVRLVPDVSVGDEAVRASASATIRGDAGARVRLALEPRAEYRRDEGFGLHRRDWRASVVARLRRLSGDELGALRLMAGSEVVRSLEGSDAFVLSGTSARAAIGYSRAPLFGPEWDVEYGVIARAFRDSTDRDHVEHRVVASLRALVGAGHDVSLAAGMDRRLANRDVPGSRDRFTRIEAEAGAGLSFASDWSLRADVRGELLRYDDPDSLVEFDYGVARSGLMARREFGPGWRAGAGTRVEWLVAPWAPEEDYVEIAGVLELERMTGTALWHLAPAAGHRRYSRTAPPTSGTDLLAPTLHSSFDFVELTGFLDQPLPGGLRARATGVVRAERHEVADHDARSLYFSLDLRRLF